MDVSVFAASITEYMRPRNTLGVTCKWMGFTVIRVRVAKKLMKKLTTSAKGNWVRRAYTITNIPVMIKEDQ